MSAPTRRSALLPRIVFAVVAASALAGAITAVNPAAASPLLPPGGLMLSTQQDAWIPGGSAQPGWLTFYCLLSPPQIPARSIAFRISAPSGLWIVDQTAPGLVDQDPSYDGFELVRTAECDGSAWPTMLLQLRVIFLNQSGAGLVQLLPRAGTSTFPPRPSYRTCERGQELPLLLGGRLCEPPGPAWEGVVVFGSTCGGFISWPALQMVHAGVNRAGDGSGTFVLQRTHGFHYEETGCYPLPPTVSIEFTSTWDSTIAEVLWVEPALPVQGWAMSYSLAPGAAHVSLAANGLPPIEASAVPLASYGYRSKGTDGVTGIITTVDDVRTPTGVMCSVEATEGQFRSGCVSADVHVDGHVDVGDAVLAHRIVDGTLVPGYRDLCAADLDGNLAVQTEDVFAVLDAVLSSGSTAAGYLPSTAVTGDSSQEAVVLTVAAVSGIDARLQLDPSRQQVVSITAGAGLLRWQQAESGSVRVLLADGVDAARTLTVLIETQGSGPLPMVTGLIGYDAQGEAIEVPFEVQGAVVAAQPQPSATRSRLLPAAPNPFNPRTMLRFELARAGAVRLAIHDASGRRVRSFAQSWLAAGPHEIPWDGRDDDGRAVASGVYRLRLSTADGDARDRSVVLLR